MPTEPEIITRYSRALCEYILAAENEVMAMETKRKKHYELLRVKDELRSLEYDLLEKIELVNYRKS